MQNFLRNSYDHCYTWMCLIKRLGIIFLFAAFAVYASPICVFIKSFRNYFFENSFQWGLLKGTHTL